MIQPLQYKISIASSPPNSDIKIETDSSFDDKFPKAKSSLPTGIYFHHPKLGNISTTPKISLIRQYIAPNSSKPIKKLLHFVSETCFVLYNLKDHALLEIPQRRIESCSQVSIISLTL